jgi:hypothetical protein
LVGAQVEPSFRERDNYLMMQQKTLKMNGSITLEPPFMLEVVAHRSDLAEPRVEVFKQPRLIVCEVRSNTSRAFFDWTVIASL